MKTRNQTPQKPVATARSAALDIMLEVTEGQRLMAEVAPEGLAHLGPGDRARAGRLATETLRWSQRADRMIGRYVRQKPPEDVLNILRLGAYELHVAGEQPHGVVSSLVSLARQRTGQEGLARMTNAVLRRIAEATDWESLPVPELPKPLRKRLNSAWGKARVAAMEAVQAAPPPLDLTAKSDPGRVAAATGGTLLPTGSVRLREAGQVSALAGFEAGAWWVQDAAAALPVGVLAPRPCEAVLDLCAAPGGKTMQLAAAGAEVTALDVSGPRLATLHENLARTGLGATVVEADALDWTGGPFDAVLLDAPCSATGTIRRHPDLPL
ncbi:MAG: transcription antitermination factor NusB, partial [Paracoccaceae bacterium]|nr:transcription antitermination factor NusB [Paracoccaceae bacterium]